MCQKTVKNEAQKAKKTNRTPTIIWEVRVLHAFLAFYSSEKNEKHL